MQMARMFERSVSSTIRYHGAIDPEFTSPTFEDTIQDALDEQMRRRDSHVVEEGEVLVTTSGRLRESHGVKAILHAATVTGKACDGFESISDARLVDCVCMHHPDGKGPGARGRASRCWSIAYHAALRRRARTA